MKFAPVRVYPPSPKEAPGDRVPSVDDPLVWRKLLNALYLHGEDDLFRWVQALRDVGCDERNKATEPGRTAA